MARPRKQADKVPKSVKETPQLDPNRGYIFPIKDKTPEDYMANPETGIRPGDQKQPWGVAKTDITKGIEGATIPGMAVWEAGKWCSDLSDKARGFFATVTEKEEWATWCVSGEGTPGNYAFRAYVLPKDLATSQFPRHPSQWPDNIKKGRAATSYAHGHPSPYGQGYGTGYGGQGVQGGYKTPAAPAKPAAPKAPAMPASLRIRCSGCGHWFKMDDLPRHAEWACPGINGEGDWAMMCDSACGCSTLHEAASVKPGFPRKPIMAGKKAEEEEKKEVKENGSDGNGSVDPDVREAAVAAPAGD